MFRDLYCHWPYDKRGKTFHLTLVHPSSRLLTWAACCQSWVQPGDPVALWLDGDIRGPCGPVSPGEEPRNSLLTGSWCSLLAAPALLWGAARCLHQSFSVFSCKYSFTKLDSFSRWIRILYSFKQFCLSKWRVVFFKYCFFIYGPLGRPGLFCPPPSKLWLAFVKA